MLTYIQSEGGGEEGGWSKEEGEEGEESVHKDEAEWEWGLFEVKWMQWNISDCILLYDTWIMILNGAVFDLKPGGDGAKLGRAFFLELETWNNNWRRFQYVLFFKVKHTL